MQTATYRVTIERHDVGQIPALTFLCDGNAADCPMVFTLHGLTSRKERLLDLCLRLAEAGFRAVMFDARSHGERRDGDSLLLNGDRQSPEFLGAFARTMVGTIEDMATLVDYFGASRYAVVGHSMGGFLAMHAALMDSRVSAVVNIGGSLTLPEPDNLPPDMASLLEMADVGARAEALVPRPVLLLHGGQDVTVPVAGAERLIAALQSAYGENASRVKLHVYPDEGHEFTSAMTAVTVQWLRENYLNE